MKSLQAEKKLYKNFTNLFVKCFTYSLYSDNIYIERRTTECQQQSD
jgi:hypothetical protein